MTYSTASLLTKNGIESLPKIVILEGVDRVGKTSMQLAINKATNFKHIVVDRGPIGFKTYCELYGRDKELFKEYDEIERKLMKIDNVLVIYIDCPTEILIDRCFETHHKIIDYNLHKKIYEYYYNISPLNKIKVDTGFYNVDEIVEGLVKEGIL